MTELRPAEDSDLLAVGAVHHRSRAAAYAGFLPPEAASFGTPEALGEWWAERWRWERDTHRLTVAEADGEVVGFTYLGPADVPDAPPHAARVAARDAALTEEVSA